MKKLLLIGAGHVHIALLAHAPRLRAAGFDIHLIDPGSFWYGGARHALLAGRLQRAALRLPLRAFCQRHRVSYHADRAIGLELRHRRLWLAGGSMQVFHTLSHDVGYDTASAIVSDSHHGPRLWPATDVSAMLQLAEILAQAGGRGRAKLRVAVAGAGPRALDSIAALACGPFAPDLRLAWFLPGTRPVPAAPRAHDRFIVRRLAGRGVDIVANTALERSTHGALCSRDGRRFALDHVIDAGAGEAAHFVHAGGLPAGARGLRVNARLQSPRDERIYAVGSCAAMPGGDECAPVGAHRQARVLAHNIEAGARRRPFRHCRARRGGPIADLGDGRAIVWRGRWWWHGHALARRLARRDERWLAWIAGLSERS